jgi:hypothetical protein
MADPTDETVANVFKGVAPTEQVRIPPPALDGLG